MSNKLPQRDPIAIYQRENAAARRVGEIKHCACGESRPEALNTASDPIMCEECARKKKEKTTMDRHHIAGEANSSVTIPVPANDHRAELSVLQQDWPAEILENPDGSPILKAAACIQGFADIIAYLIKEFLLWIVDMLVLAHAHLQEKLGPRWWEKTELNQFSPNKRPQRRKKNDKR